MEQGLESYYHPHDQATDALSGYVPMGSVYVVAEYDRVSRLLANTEGNSGQYNHGVVDRQRDPILDHVEGQSRDYFSRLAPWQRAELNERLSQVAPNSLRPQDSNQDWAEHLESAPRQQIVNLWEWNADRVGALNNDPKLHAEVEAHTVSYRAAVTAAVEAEYLPPQATWALEKAITTPVVVGDVFNLEMGGYAGYCLPGGERIVTGERITNHTLTHERGHVLGRFPYEPLNEAVVEHITLGLLDGDFATVAPDQRSTQGAYRSKRYLMHAVMTLGLVEIGVRDFVDPYIERDGDNSATMRLRQKAADAYPSVNNIWDHISDKRNGHRLQVQDRFPGAPEMCVEGATDWYATLAVGALGHIAKRRYAKDFQKAVDDMVDNVAETAVTCRKAQPPLPPATILNAEMESYSTRRFAEDFRLGTSFLE